MSTRDPERDYQFVDALKHERMKTFVKRDVSGRVVVLYEAVVGAVDGDRILATVYTYTGASAQPTGTKEVDAIWDGTWDIDLDAILVNGDLGYTP